MYRKVCSDKRQHRPDNRYVVHRNREEGNCKTNKGFKKGYISNKLVGYIGVIRSVFIPVGKIRIGYKNYNVCLSTKVSEESSY